MNTFLAGLLPAMAREGIATDVLTRGRGATVEVTTPVPGVRVFHLPCGWEEGPPTREGASRSLPPFVSAARSLLRGGIAGGHEVASAHYWMSGVASLAILDGGEGHLARVPLAFSYHTIEARKVRAPGASPDSLSSRRDAAERALSRSVDAVVCLSSFDLAATAAIFPDVGPRGAVIPPGIDDRFRNPPGRAEARRALGLPVEGVLFLLAARDDAGKNVREAVEAVARLRADGRVDARLVVVGHGGRDEGVVYAGAVPHEAMPAWYAAADAVVCPSRYESFGLVPLESMACGTPVVAPETVYWGGRIASEGGGSAYDATSPGALEQALARIASDTGFRERLGVEARAVAAPFTWSRCAGLWGSLLSRLARPGGRRGTPRSRDGRRRR